MSLNTTADSEKRATTSASSPPALATFPALLTSKPNSPMTNTQPSYKSSTWTAQISPLAARAGSSRGRSASAAQTSTTTTTSTSVLAVVLSAILALALLAYPASADLQVATPGSCLNSSKLALGPLNRLEPPRGYKPLMGFGLDWLNDTTSKIDTRLGRRPAVIGGWVKIFPNQSWEDWNLYKMAVGVANAPRPPNSAPPILMVALMPEITFAGNKQPINISTFHNISANLARVNYEFGIPILLRFCHEMNGPWSAYGQQPVDFIRVWRQFVPILRNYTNMTAMLWAPNIVESYPYMPYQVLTNLTDPNSVAMDTNKDGIIDAADDGYTPYWPGAEYVDWVGISSYYQGGNSTALNSLPPADRFNEAIRGNFTWNPILYNFHDMFAKKYNKPMAVPETGARYYLNASTGIGDGEVNIKRNWWNQVFNATTSGDWQHLMMIAWFEEAKLEGGSPVDYTITWNATVRRALLRDLPYDMMQWADNVTYACDGQILENSNPAQEIGPGTWTDPQPQMEVPDEVVWPTWEIKPTPATPRPTKTSTSKTTSRTPSLTIVSGTIVVVPTTTTTCPTRNCPESNGAAGLAKYIGLVFTVVAMLAGMMLSAVVA